MSIKDDIKRKATEKLLTKYVNKYLSDPVWAWQEVRDAAQSANQAGKEEIAKALVRTDVIKSHLRSLAEQEADALLADDSLDLNELNRIFG